MSSDGAADSMTAQLRIKTSASDASPGVAFFVGPTDFEPWNVRGPVRSRRILVTFDSLLNNR